MSAKLSDTDAYLFNEGTHRHIYRWLGAHPCKQDGVSGTRFAVWAPSAQNVEVLGDFNGWSGDGHPLKPLAETGVWAGFIPGVGAGVLYKYGITTAVGEVLEKTDPVAFAQEVAPRTASVVCDLSYAWDDAKWLENRAERQNPGAPISVYEVHLGSWARVPEENNRSLTYREIAPRLADHVEKLGFTHVELMPVMEHPFFGSWGYQVTGYFAATSRWGSPQDLMFLIDTLHQRGIGVLLDWVPAHFPKDGHGLARFDGSHLYEHSDPRQGHHPDWDTAIFNYSRHEVRSFLTSSAIFWLDHYHVDGLRVDAVASMLYLDYSRQEGEWIPNQYGGRENIEAIELLRHTSDSVHETYPGALMVAEESTAWGGVTKPTQEGGLAFDFKWDMGWMHDTLKYLARDSVHRSHHQNAITFRMIYAFSEHFMLPLSHDEVVHGKGSLKSRMPGDTWQQMANLRLLLAYQYAQPGKKLLFMGTELAPDSEWNHEASLDWHLEQDPAHNGIGTLIADLNRHYRAIPALHQRDGHSEGFDWIDASDNEASVMSFLRWADGFPPVIAVFNFTAVPRHDYSIGTPLGGAWREFINTDAAQYGGSNVGNGGQVSAHTPGIHGRPHALSLTLPPMAALFLTPA